jgi:peptidylprolyl isomerase
MEVVQGDEVSVDYEGRFESGEVFDTSKHGDHSHPLTFVVGSGQMIVGFDKAVLGMKENEEKEVTLEPQEAYGLPRDDLNKEFPLSSLPSGQEPKEGLMLMLSTPDGHQIPAKISKLTKDKVTIDLNHPLAGKRLIFKIKLLSIKQGKQ